MIENNKDTKIQTESQSTSESNKPWYKKRSTIIAASSILGAGVMATVIAVPIAVTTKTTVNPVTEAINALNVGTNKDSRITLWNDYAISLNNAPPVTPFSNSKGITENSTLSKIVYTTEFVTEFINLLTDNLYVTTAGTETGAITQVNANLIKKSLLEKQNLFEDSATTSTYTDYVDLFSLKSPTSVPILTFKDNATTGSETIHFKFYMPRKGIDLTYNNDKTVSFKTPAEPPTGSTIPSLNENEHVRLEIIKFANPAITSTTIYYFKPNSTIKLPSVFMNDFTNFFDNSVTTESKFRKALETGYQTFKTSVDSTPTSGLSYWNSFALTHATSNKNLLEADFKKELVNSGFYAFIKEAANLTEPVLAALRAQLMATSNGLFATPFVQSPSYTNELFKTTNTDAAVNTYSLTLNITKFTYDFTVGNLFSGPDAIKITPKLTLGDSSKLIQTSNATGNAKVEYPITKKEYDFSNLIDITNDPSSTKGGLGDFLDNLIVLPNDSNTLTTKGLVAFNNKSTLDQMIAWNTYVANQTNKQSILNELKKPDVLYNFINSYVTSTNKFGMGQFPTVIDNDFKSSINTVANNLTIDNIDLSFSNTTTSPAITLTDVAWGANAQNEKFTIKIYFGYEADSISNINVTSNMTNGANMSLSQAVATDSIDNTSTIDQVTAAAKKRLSIVFETSNTIYHIAYLGQQLDGTTQVARPIIIPNTILTVASNFIEFIKTQK